MKSRMVLLLAAAIFCGSGLARAENAAAGPYFFVQDPARSLELVDFYRQEANQKALLARLSSESEKTYYRKLFADIRSTHDRAYVSGPVATFFTKSHGIYQVMTIKYPTLFMVNGKLLSIPKDKSNGIIDTGTEILKAIEPVKGGTGKSALFRSSLAPEAHAFNNGVPSNILFLHLGKPALNGPAETNSDDRAANPRRIPDELVETFGGKAGGVMTCGPLEAKVEGGALEKYGFKIRKIFAQDAIEITGKTKVIRLTVPKVATEQGLQYIQTRCLEKLSAERCEKEVGAIRKQNPTFINAEALESLSSAQVCDRNTGRDCAPLGAKDLDALKKDADGFSFSSLASGWMSAPKPVTDDERKRVSRTLIASAQVLAMAEPLCTNSQWWNAAAWAFEIRRDTNISPRGLNKAPGAP